MKQVFYSRVGNRVGIDPNYGNPFNPDDWSTTESSKQVPWPIAATLSNFAIRTSTAPGVGNSYTFVVRIAGSNTSLTITISGTTTEGSCTGVNVAVAAGDLVSVKMSFTGSPPGTPTFDVYLESDSSDDNTSGYALTASNSATSSTRFNGIFRGAGWVTPEGHNSRDIVAVAGTLTGIRYRLDTAPGSGKSWTFNVVLNGTVQDGTGGTVDTTTTISDLATTATATFTLPLAVGDVVSMQLVPAGTPAAANLAYGSTFVATTGGYSQYCGHLSANVNTGSTSYADPSARHSPGSWDTTESAIQPIAALSAFQLRGLIIRSVNAPGSGKSYVFTGRVASASPSGAPTVTISDAETTDSDSSNSMAIAIGEAWDLQSVPSGTPAGTQVSWAFGMFVPLPFTGVTQVLSLLVVSRDPDPAIADDPAGGGTVGASTDPDPGVDLCGADVPVAFLDITPPGGTTVRYTKQPINVTVADDPRVKTFGSVTRALTNRSGDLRGSQASPILIDTDRVLRGLEDSDSLVNAVIEYFLSTESAIKAGATPRREFSGLVTDSEPQARLLMRLQASDYLQSMLEVQPPATHPQRVFSVADFPSLANDPNDPVSPGNPTLIGKPIPICYGQLSDEALGPDAVGVVPAFFTGRRLLPVYETFWDEYVICGHAVGAMQSLFIPIGPTLSTGTAYAARAKMTVDAPLVEYLMPGMPGWTTVFGSSAPYRDFNGNRYTVVYGFGPRSDLNRTGQVPLVANLWGIEDVGDGTGDVITSLPRQIAHLLINWVLQSYASGAWLSPPTVSGYSRLSTAGFEAAKTRSEARIAGGHVGAFILAADGSTETLASLARRFYEHGLALGTNKDGQIIGSAIDPTASPVRAISDITDTLAATFSARRQRSEIRNRVLYRYAKRYVPLLQEPTPAEGAALPPSLQIPAPDWTVDNQEDSDSASITKYGQRTMDLSLALTRDAATADDLAALHLEVLAAGPMVATYREGLCGTAVDLGDTVALDHFEGPTAVGYAARELRAEVQTVDLDRFEVEVQGLDLENLPAS